MHRFVILNYILVDVLSLLLLNKHNYSICIRPDILYQQNILNLYRYL